jgi:NADPH2:quinone reductase
LRARSLDSVLDTVGGDAFGVFVDAVRPGGTLSLVGAVAGSRVTFEAYRLLDVVLTGFTSEALDGERLRSAIASIAAWLRDGALRVPAYRVLPLESAADAHDRMERHSVTGRVLLVPSGIISV